MVDEIMNNKEEMMRIFKFAFMMLSIFTLCLSEGTFNQVIELGNDSISSSSQEAIYAELSTIGQLIGDTFFTKYANINFTPDGLVLNLNCGSIPIEGYFFDNELYSMKLKLTPSVCEYEPTNDLDWQCRNCRQWNPNYLKQCRDCGHVKPINPKYYKDARRRIG